MVKMMADQNVAKQIAVIEAKIDNHATLLEKVSEGVETNAVLTERIVNITERMHEYRKSHDLRFEEHENRISKIEKRVWIWTGVLIVLASIPSFLLVAINFLKVLP